MSVLDADALAVVALFCGAFLFATVFFTYFLFRDYDVKYYSVQTCFSLVFSLGAVIFGMIICEVAGVLDTAFRRDILKANLALLCLLLITIIPVFFLLTLFSELGWSRGATNTATTSAYALFLLTFYWVGESTATTSAAWFPTSLWPPSAASFLSERVIASQGTLGLAFLSLLSGFGSVDGPVTMTSFFLREVNEGAIVAQERALHRLARRILQHKRRALSAEASRLPDASASCCGRLLRRRAQWGHGGRGGARRSKREVVALENAASALFADINEMRQEQHLHRRSRTLYGFLLSIGGICLALYGVVRVILALRSIILLISPKTDNVTSGLQHLSRFLALFGWHLREKDLETPAQAISLVFVATQVSVSVRGFLNTVLRVFNRVSGSASTNVVVLLLAEALGLFFVSTLLMFRMKLRPTHRVIVTGALGDIDFDFYHHWSDSIFLVTVFVTGIYYFLTSRAKRKALEATTDKRLV